MGDGRAAAPTRPGSVPRLNCWTVEREPVLRCPYVRRPKAAAMRTTTALTHSLASRMLLTLLLPIVGLYRDNVRYIFIRVMYRGSAETKGSKREESGIVIWSASSPARDLLRANYWPDP
jgi:hypothetical protein